MSDDTRTLPLLDATDADHLAVARFHVLEAEHLDTWNLGAWLAMLAADYRYLVPTQVTHVRQNPEVVEHASYLYDDNRFTTDMRIKRLVESNTVWAENPRSRSTRFVSNLRVRRTAHGELHAWSNLLLTRNRGGNDHTDIITGERHDVFERGADGLLLRTRTVRIDQARLPMGNLPYPI